MYPDTPPPPSMSCGRCQDHLEKTDIGHLYLELKSSKLFLICPDSFSRSFSQGHVGGIG